MGYSAKRNSKGHLVIANVPIFVECSRGEHQFNCDWIDAAVQRASQAEGEGYLPPLHVKHHEESIGGHDPVQPAGYFRIIGTSNLTFKGQPRKAIYADLTITDPDIEEHVLRDRLPYRSVEIFNVDKPNIDSLALLDHQAPYLELPMLMVSEVDDENVAAQPTVAHATFANPWLSQSAENRGPVVACFRRGLSAHVFMQEADVAYQNDDDKKKQMEREDDEAKKKAPMTREDDQHDDKKKVEMAEEEDDEKKENMQEVDAPASPVDDMLAALAGLSPDDLQRLHDGVMAAMQPAEQEEAMPEEVSAMVPGEMMSKQATLMRQIADLTGSNAAMQRRLDDLHAATQRKEDVAVAMKRLEGRPLGHDVETKLNEWHKEHGREAFASYVEDFAKAFARVADFSHDKAERFAAQSGSVSNAAMEYSQHGTDAVDKAQKFSREYQQLAAKGLTRSSEQNYVKTNMTRLGFTAN